MNFIPRDIKKPPRIRRINCAKEPKVSATTISLPTAARSRKRPDAI